MANTDQPTTCSTSPQLRLAAMPQLTEAINREDDWTGTKDPAARRRAQTRLNTRAYRKRKVLAKKAEGPNPPTTGTLVKSEALIECWDIDRQSISVISATRANKLYNARNPLLQEKSKKKQNTFVFPLCADHLITLLQFNALRAMATNRTIVTGKIVTPLDCEDEIIHLTPYPADPERFPSSLLPTALQQTVPHGNWIDMWPSPEGRDRLIRATGTFDEDDLWDDCIGGLYEGFPDDEITRRGVIAWSPPWDITGWEMSEGFLKKWGWLVAGLPGVIEATNKWRMKRGEEPVAIDLRTGASEFAPGAEIPPW